MGFWIFMLIMELLIPVMMIIFGRLFLKRAPREINMVFGYRTTMSMKNKDTWEFAHKYFGKLWYICGLILLPLSVVPMLFTIGQAEDVVGAVGETLCTIQVILLIAPIIPTEIALRKTFDQNGCLR